MQDTVIVGLSLEQMKAEAESRYQQLVEEGRELVANLSRNQWELGDKALEVAPVGAGHTNSGANERLRQYAKDIGERFQTLRRYRAVAAAWPEGRRRPSVSWSIHAELLPHPEKEEVVEEVSTVREARERVRELDDEPERDEHFPERVRELSERLSSVAYDDAISRELEAILERVDELSPGVVAELGSALREAAGRLSGWTERLAIGGQQTTVTVLRKELA